MVYNTKRCSTQGGKNPVYGGGGGTGQVMQETEHSVPPERLAGSMPFQGLRKPQALPGRLTLVHAGLPLLYGGAARRTMEARSILRALT